jgi:hypothetical protein
MKRVLALTLAFALTLALAGCSGGGSEIVLPPRVPTDPPPAAPAPEPQQADRYLVVGQTLLGMCTAQGVWQPAAALPDGTRDWIVLGETVTRYETLPQGIPAGTLAVSGGEAEKLALHTGSAWEPASDLLYALLRTLTGTEPLFDQPQVNLLASGDLLGDGTVARILAVRGSYGILVLEHNGDYSALPGCSEFLVAYRMEGRTLLLCGTAAGGLRLLSWNGQWETLLAADPEK